MPRGVANHLPEITPEQAKRFWSHVDIKPVTDPNAQPGSPENPCWLWTGGLFKRYGYGQTGFGRKARGIRAHRVAYFLHTGLDPGNYDILHHCDVLHEKRSRRCCNPGHMTLGTRKQNLDDRDAKGRTARGEQDGNAVLTDEKVRLIRLMGQNGMKAREIAAVFGVNHVTIWFVLKRRTWKHVV
jgi:hypothetical protein